MESPALEMRFQGQEHGGESGDGIRLEGTQHGSSDIRERRLGDMLRRCAAEGCHHVGRMELRLKAAQGGWDSFQT